MSSKREREEDGELIVGETMCIMPIGAGNEVGRSCIILKYMGKTIMLDCGIHPVSQQSRTLHCRTQSRILHALSSIAIVVSQEGML
jgi:Cft2 family RNA processing exonuclease